MDRESEKCTRWQLPGLLCAIICYMDNLNTHKASIYFEMSLLLGKVNRIIIMQKSTGSLKQKMQG